MITNYEKFVNEAKKIWTINDPEYFKIFKYEWSNGLLNCFQDVEIKSTSLPKLPFNFGKIVGYFKIINNNKLLNLDGCPTEVTENFYCNQNNKLTNLVGLPEKIGNVFYCIHNTNLISLTGAEKTECSYFKCQENNKLTNLMGSPISDTYWVLKNNKLLNLIGIPTQKVKTFKCSDNDSMTSFEGFPKRVGFFECFDLKKIARVDMEKYPVSIVDDINTNIHYFTIVREIVKNNEEKFIPLLDDKVRFHQMVMRLDPSYIKYYFTIPPPSQKTIL